MTLYETTFIINPQTDDATIDRNVRDVADVITRNQGQIRFEDHMGTRRLAYEIQGLTQGYYASFIFEAPTAALPLLERHFKLNEQYIRHLTVRYEGLMDKLAPPQGTEPEKTETTPTPEAAEPEKTETTPSPEATEPAEVPEAEEAEKPAAEVEADTAKIETVAEPAEPKSDDTGSDTDTDIDKEDQEL